MQAIAQKWFYAFLATGALDADDRDIFIYGFEVLVSSVGTLVATLLFGSIAALTAETIAYLAVFTPVRGGIGGFHASSARKCFLLTLSITAVGTYWGRLLTPWLIVAMTITSLLLIFTFAPFIHPNNPHTPTSQHMLRARARTLGVAVSITIGIACNFQPSLAAVMATAFFTAAMGMLAGKLMPYQAK